MNGCSGLPRSERKKLSCTTSSPIAAGSIYHAPLGDRIWAWKPCGVTSKTIVAAGSSTPCPAYVVISGNAAANSGAMTADSHTLNDIIDPSGAGKSMANDPAPLELSGASASTDRIAARLKLNPREVSGPLAAATPAWARARPTDPADTSTNGSAFGCGVSAAAAFPGATPTTDASNIAAPTSPLRTLRARIVSAENILPPLDEQPGGCQATK